MKPPTPFVSATLAVLYGASAIIAAFVSRNWLLASLFGIGASLFMWWFWAWKPEPRLFSMKPFDNSEEEIQKAIESIKQGRDLFKDWVTEHGVLDKETGAFVHGCYSIYLEASNENMTIDQFADVTDTQIEAAMRRIVEKEKAVQ